LFCKNLKSTPTSISSLSSGFNSAPRILSISNPVTPAIGKEILSPQPSPIELVSYEEDV